MIGAMRRMAEGAILRHGRVLPEERAAFLGVALVAGLVDRLPHELKFERRPVRTMAGRAAHLAGAKRMRVRLHGRRPHGRMALVTD